jgi:hypothetical protein
VKAPKWLATDWVRVEVSNQITWQMTRLPSGESRDDEPKPDLLGLGFASSGVGDGGFGLWYGVAGWSVIERSVVPLDRGSTAGDLLPSSDAGALTNPATMNGVAPSSGLTSRPRSTCDLEV